MQFKQKHYSCFQAQNKKILQNFKCVDGLCKKALTTGTGFFALTKTQVLEIIRNEYIANTLLNVFA